MRDYNGVQIDAGDYVEVRADGEDVGSTFYSGNVVMSDGELCLLVPHVNAAYMNILPLTVLERSNDVVVVNKGDGLID